MIPAAIKPANYNQGAVSGTDSESENEFSKKLRGNRVKKPLKWTEELENYLESVLIKHQFDFKVAHREFLR